MKTNVFYFLLSVPILVGIYIQVVEIYETVGGWFEGDKTPVAADTDDAFAEVVEESTPQPETPEPEPMFSESEIETMESIASGMVHIKEKKDRGQWYMCGERLDHGGQLRTSLQIAEQIMLNVKSLGVDFDPWGVAGTMFNESRFDPCAFGKHPRNKALELGLLKKERRGFSHARVNVLRAIADPRMKRRFKTSGYDLGLCQILTRFYRDEVVEMTTIEDGVRICVLEMQARARRNKTKTPWLYWRGSKTPWYLSKVNRWVKQMKRAENGNDKT